MNVFYVDHDPVLAAQYLVDAHVRKMLVESCQMLATNAQLLFNQSQPYRPTHQNHPCTVWARNSLGNCRWLLNHTAGLLMEYHYRFGKLHKSNEVYTHLWGLDWRAKLSGDLTQPALAMPDQYKSEDPVISYRSFYVSEKREDKRGRSMLVWTRRKAPWWHF